LISDSSGKVIHIENSGLMHLVDSVGQARYFALTTINVRKNSSYIHKSFAVDKLLVVVAPKQ